VSLASGRGPHTQKITVYLTNDELHHLEQARLTLRRDHGIAVDRGHIVREAITTALDDLPTLATRLTPVQEVPC